MARKAPKDKKPVTTDDIDGSKTLIDPQRELFCILFTTNTLPNFWGNGQHSYSFAYGHDERIEKIQDEIGELDLKKKADQSKAKKLRKQITSIERSCRSSAPRLLASDSVKKRCAYLIDQLSSLTVVDRELIYTIQQRDDLDVKMRAIEHHDKRVGRIKEKVELKHQFAPIEGFNFFSNAEAKPVKAKK